MGAEEQVPGVEPLLGITPPDEDAPPAIEPMTGIEPDEETAAEREKTWEAPGDPAPRNSGDAPAGA